MGTTMTTKKSRLKRGVVALFAASLTLLAWPESASAQEIQLTGPLAGAPAVRKLRLRRQGRFEIAPGAAFTLLDEYRRTIIIGARLNYNLTEWLAIGAWGGAGVVKITTSLSDHIQDLNEIRKTQAAGTTGTDQPLDHRLTKVNIGNVFKDQLASTDWVLSPQLTLVPFRGKLALFQSIYLDTDLYFFGGPAFVGVKERNDCETNCAGTGEFEMASRMAIAPSFGLGFSFYMAKWAALGFEWRGLPYAVNNGGFDTAGGSKDNAFPDNRITSDDRQFHFNQMLNVSFNFHLPTQYKIGE